MIQTSADTLAEDVPFEGSKHGQQPSHRSTRRRGQIQRLRHRNKTHAECGQFPQRGNQIRNGSAPAVQPPFRHDINFPPPRGVEQLFAERPRHSAGARLFRFCPNASATLGRVLAQQRAHPHRKRLLIKRGDARIKTRPQHFRPFA